MEERAELILAVALILLIIPVIGGRLGLGFGWLWFLKGIYHAFAPAHSAGKSERTSESPEEPPEDDSE
jgi:hypothetical protein